MGENTKQFFFTFEKVKNDFICTQANKKLEEITNVPQEFLVGAGIYNETLPKEISDRLYKVYNKAWKGNQILYYFVPPANEKVILFVVLKPIISQGKVVEVEGHGVGLDSVQFEQFRELFSKFGPFEQLHDEEK